MSMIEKVVKYYKEMHVIRKQASKETANHPPNLFTEYYSCLQNDMLTLLILPQHQNNFTWGKELHFSLSIQAQALLHE